MRLFPLFLLLCINCFSQERDYADYHKNINKAEELFFMQNNADSALFYYDKVFTEYDFIYVKDLVNAAQLAIFSKKPYLKYIEQGFEQGLKLSHLKKYPLFAKVLPDLLNDKKLASAYKTARHKYISRINFDYLDKIYKMAIADQKSKTSVNYISGIQKTTNKLESLIRDKGFPGDRIIGIADSTIFKEIGKPQLDLYEQRKADPDLFYMTSDEHILSANWPQILLVHNPCAYHLYKDLLLAEMKKGNIHPRDIALIHDNAFRFKNDLPGYCNGILLKGVYRLNMFTDYSRLNNRKETNEMRKKLYITSLELDEKKQEFEYKYGFRLFSGFWGCR